MLIKRQNLQVSEHLTLLLVASCQGRGDPVFSRRLAEIVGNDRDNVKVSGELIERGLTRI